MRAEVIQAGGWSSSGVGDVLSAEDVYVLLSVDGLVARTATRKDARQPTWLSDERRAFEMEVRDAAATLFVAVADEDDEPMVRDGYIGRAALPVRSLRPGTTYDAWLPLRRAGSREEERAIDARHLVKGTRLRDAASLNITQTQSRGAVRLRLRVDWDDGGVKAARSVVASLTGGTAEPRHVVLPESASGRKQRDVCRFALYGEAGDHGDPLVEPVSTARVRDHLSDLLDALDAVKKALPGYVDRLVKYDRPLRSLLALVAWWTTCARGARIWFWFWLHLALCFYDRLQPPRPFLAHAQWTLLDWRRRRAGNLRRRRRDPAESPRRARGVAASPQKLPVAPATSPRPCGISPPLAPAASPRARSLPVGVAATRTTRAGAASRFSEDRSRRCPRRPPTKRSSWRRPPSRPPRSSSKI